MMLDLGPLALCIVGTGITFLATAAGSAMVFFVKKDFSAELHRIFLGFAAGIMLAASVWSLLIPAARAAAAQGGSGVIPTAGGFALGAVFLLAADSVLPHLHPGAQTPEGIKTGLSRSTLMMLAVTLHNIPEGMAVGLACAAAAGENREAGLSMAVALTIGMALQNFPEGAAISLPLCKEGMSRRESFMWGALSGAVEPVGGIAAVLVAGKVTELMPWFLSFAAGCMIYVVAEELIPAANSGDEHTHGGTVGLMVGFLLMMVLDTAL